MVPKHHNRTFKMHNFLDLDTFCNSDLNKSFREDKIDLIYNLDNAVSAPISSFYFNTFIFDGRGDTSKVNVDGTNVSSGNMWG